MLRLRSTTCITSNAVEPMICAFVEPIEQLAKQREEFLHRAGVVFEGKTQEKCTVYGTEERHNVNTSYGWTVKLDASRSSCFIQDI